jgi:hypothetical protein
MLPKKKLLCKYLLKGIARIVNLRKFGLITRTDHKTFWESSMTFLGNSLLHIGVCEQNSIAALLRVSKIGEQALCVRRTR